MRLTVSRPDRVRQLTAALWWARCTRSYLMRLQLNANVRRTMQIHQYEILVLLQILRCSNAEQSRRMRSSPLKNPTGSTDCSSAHAGPIQIRD